MQLKKDQWTDNSPFVETFYYTQQHQQTAGKQQIDQKANSIFSKWNYGNYFMYEFKVYQ